MSVVIHDSFDHSYEVHPNAIIGEAVGRRGGGCLHFLNTGFNALNLRYAWPLTTAPTHYVGFALRTSDGGVWSTRGITVGEFYYPYGTVLLSLVTGDNGALELWRDFENTGGGKTLIATYDQTIPTIDTYAFYELGITWGTGTSGTVIMRQWIGGVLTETYTDAGIDTGIPANPVGVWLAFYPFVRDGDAGPCHLFYDDLYILDSHTPGYNTFLGDRTVTLLVPSGFTVSGGWSVFNGANFRVVVDEEPSNYDVDYLYSNPGATAGDYIRFANSGLSAYNLTDVVPSARFILSMRSTGGGTNSVRLQLERMSTATLFALLDTTTSTSYPPQAVNNIAHVIYNPFEAGSTPWTVEAIEDLRFGPYILADSANSVRVSGVYVEVMEPLGALAAVGYRSWARITG